MDQNFIKSNGIQIHYLEKNSTKKPTVILLHGLSANANSFNSYLNLIKDYRVIAIDLRGRGLSDKPNSTYSIKEHALDIIGIMDELEIDKAIIAGHSFGGLLTIYLAIFFSTRVMKVALIDVAATMNPNIKELVSPPTTGRLNKSWRNYQDYIADMKRAPFLKQKWSSDIESFYRADCIEVNKRIKPRTNVKHVQKAIEAVLNPNINWGELITQIKQPTIVINAREPFINNQYIVSKQNALETVNMIQNCTYKQVAGNHVTMLFDNGAKQTVKAFNKLINK